VLRLVEILLALPLEQYLVKISRGVSWPAIPTNYFPNDQIKDSEVDHVARTGKEGFNFGLGGKLRERDHLKFRRRCERGIKIDLQEIEWQPWSGLIWLTIDTNGGLF
jgi:hypothetical protein